VQEWSFVAMVTHTNTIGGANEDNQQYIFFYKALRFIIHMQ